MSRFEDLFTEPPTLLRAERRAAPKPARAPLGGRPMYPWDGGPK
jgi:hypothetical protein